MSRKITRKKSRRGTSVATPLPSRRPSRLLALLGGSSLVVLLVLASWVVWNDADGSSPDFEIVKSYRHDRKAFTQGLLYDEGFFYESTGIRGESTLRKVEIETGKVLKSVKLNERHFGEGLALWKDRLIQLTWESRVGLVYDKETFSLLEEFSYETEGWGLTHNGRHLIVSDGTATLRFLDPETFKVVDTLLVTTATGRPVRFLNELEYVQGEVYANILNSNRIARISPRTGKVAGWIDLESVARQMGVSERKGNVLNGIAYDPKGKRLFVTGKLWPKVFEIRMKKK